MKSSILRVLDTPAKKATHTTLDTILVTPDLVKGWKNPPFQRPLKVNAKVLGLAEQVKQDGVIPGVITLGVLARETYLLDGQHRREAFLLSELAEGFCDVRKHLFDSMADMGAEFVNLNSQLVRLRPDDILRGLEGTTEGLRAIRDTCPWVGYDMIRRNERSPVLGMSPALRAWFGSATEVPTSSGGGSALECARRTTAEEGEACSAFLKVCYHAWGRDAEFARLWGGLNLTICAWLYRNTVIAQYSPNTPKLTKDQFGKCLTSLSAESPYVEWLHGRTLNETNRAPCYRRVKDIFVARLFAESGKKVRMPAPAWVHS